MIIFNDFENDEPMRHGVIVSGLRTDVARFGLEAAVRRGAPPQDISTPQAAANYMLNHRVEGGVPNDASNPKNLEKRKEE